MCRRCKHLRVAFAREGMRVRKSAQEVKGSLLGQIQPNRAKPGKTFRHLTPTRPTSEKPVIAGFSRPLRPASFPSLLLFPPSLFLLFSLSSHPSIPESTHNTHPHPIRRFPSPSLPSRPHRAHTSLLSAMLPHTLFAALLLSPAFASPLPFADLGAREETQRRAWDLDARDLVPVSFLDYSVPLTYPTAGVVWQAGGQGYIAWSVSSPSSYRGPAGRASRRCGGYKPCPTRSCCSRGGSRLSGHFYLHVAVLTPLSSRPQECDAPCWYLFNGSAYYCAPSPGLHFLWIRWPQPRYRYSFPQPTPLFTFSC